MESHKVTGAAFFVNMFVTIYNVFIVIGALAANDYLIIPQFSSLPSVIWWLAFANSAITALVVAVVGYHFQQKNFEDVKKMIPVSPFVVTAVIINVLLLIANGFFPFAIFICLAYLVLFYVRFNKIPE